MTIIEKNVRLPVKVFGDLRAQLAACHIAEQQFAELVAQVRRPSRPSPSCARPSTTPSG